MYFNFVKNNITLVAITLFLISFTILMLLKPGFLYNKDGSIKTFGLGYKKKTVIPVWLVSIILAILAYYLVLYFLNYSKLKDI
tara:strand:- start:2916 stop:3164 length:249 start_codon:yes stop_codon:yes gene_type:complete